MSAFGYFRCIWPIEEPKYCSTFYPRGLPWSMPVLGSQKGDPTASCARNWWMFKSVLGLQEWTHCLGSAVLSEHTFSLGGDVQVDPALLSSSARTMWIALHCFQFRAGMRTARVCEELGLPIWALGAALMWLKWSRIIFAFIIYFRERL